MARSPALAVFFTLLFMLAYVSAAWGDASESMRCGNRLVSLGDNKAEVLIKCGTPAWKDAWTDEIINGVNTPTSVRITTDRERWVYNFGHNKFLRFLSFENGRLAKITTGDYGFNNSSSAKNCDDIKMRIGISQYEILKQCGEPAFKDTRREEQLITQDQETSKMVIKRIDEWTYNFGPNKFLRILKFENGNLVDVETGDRGF